MSEGSKIIRFIDSGYKELFCIPDGGSIKITYPPGDGRGTITRRCKYLDDYHFMTLGSGGDSYHICQFAEIMERLGARYEPEFWIYRTEPEPFTAGEEKFYTYNREEGNTCIGHLSGDFGHGGDRFQSGWYNHKSKTEQDWSDTTTEFQTELHGAVYALRQNLLMDYNHMLSYCQNHPEALIDSGDTYKRYGFKLETDTRRYYTGCFLGENTRDARFIIYAYDDAAPVRKRTRPKTGVVLPADTKDSKMFYRNDEDGNTCIGWLRGDFGNQGNDFHHSWFEQDAARKTPEFQSEFQGVMETLRKGVLKDHNASLDACRKHPEAQIPGGGDGKHFGFKLETKNRRYFVRCTTLRNDYFYVFAYDKEARTRGQSQDKPSVVKQIRDAEKAPKPPRKAKAPDKKKDGAEL